MFYVIFWYLGALLCLVVTFSLLVPVQLIRLRDDLLCIEWDSKPY